MAEPISITETKPDRSSLKITRIDRRNDVDAPSAFPAVSAAIEVENSALAAAMEEEALMRRDQIIRAAAEEEMVFFSAYAVGMISSLIKCAKTNRDLAYFIEPYDYAMEIAELVEKHGPCVDPFEMFGRYRLSKNGQLGKISSPSAVLSI